MPPRSLASVLPKVAAVAVGRRSLPFAQLLKEWPSVAGSRLALVATPLKLAFAKGVRTHAVLHLRVAGAAALEIQHDEPRIIERLNSFFGYPAIGRLRLVQVGPKPEPGKPRSTAVRPRVPPLALTDCKAIDAVVGQADLASPELGAALIRLGQTLRRHKPAPSL